MTRATLLLFPCLTFSLVSFSFGQDPIFPPGAKPEEVLKKGAGEGPAWHPKQGLFFSGGDHINRLNADGKTVEIFREGAGTNGLLFDQRGRMLCCEPKNRRVSRLTGPSQYEVLTDNYQGKKYNTPNDITVDSKGRIYFSDPRYGPREGMEQEVNGKKVEGVYRIDPDGKVKRIITHEVERANGVLVSLDDKFLYVADNANDREGGARKLWRFDLKDGEIDPKSAKVLHDWGTSRGPDGLAQDRKGRIYAAAGRTIPVVPFEDAKKVGGIYVFSPEGQMLDFTPIPNDEVTNCDFGGADLQTLYITAGGHLWSVRTSTPGYIPSAWRMSTLPTLLYSRAYNAKGETRYQPDGNYALVLSQLRESFNVVVDDQPLKPERLKSVRVVLIANPSDQAVENNPAPRHLLKEDQDVLENYVKQGGGLMIMGNQEAHNLETNHANELLGRFGMKWQDKYTDAKELPIAADAPVIGGQRWAYYSGNQIVLDEKHLAKPRALVPNDLSKKPVVGPRDEPGVLMASAELGRGRVVNVTDSGWITDSVLKGEGVNGVVIKDHDNFPIFLRLCRWLAGADKDAEKTP